MAYLGLHTVFALVDLHTQPGLFKAVRDVARVVEVFVGRDRNDYRLHRGQPQRERAGYAYRKMPEASAAKAANTRSGSPSRMTCRGVRQSR